MGYSVRKRKDRQNSWVVTLTNDGRRSQRTFRSEKDAREYAVKAQSDYDRARHNGVMERKRQYGFIEGLEQMVAEYAVKSQKCHIMPVWRWFTNNAPDAVIGQETLDAARRMQKELHDRGLKQATINNRIQVVKRVLSLAYREWDWIDLPLDAKLRKPSPKNERYVYMTENELQELIDAVPSEYPVERAIVMFAILTGMRRGELLGLRNDNVFNGGIVLHPDQTKNGRSRTIPVPESALPILAMIPFQTTPDKLRKAFEKARAAVNRPTLRFHDLRHCYATLLASKGETLTNIKELLGHSSLAVTSRYAHAMPDKWSSVLGRLPTFCNQSATKH